MSKEKVFTSSRLIARPELRDRLITVIGTRKTYIADIRAQMTLPPRRTKPPSRSWVYRVVDGRDPAPYWLVVELVKFAENDREMSVADAWAKRLDWFRERAVHHG